jgi:hypothetical protein
MMSFNHESTVQQVSSSYYPAAQSSISNQSLSSTTELQLLASSNQLPAVAAGANSMMSLLSPNIVTCVIRFAAELLDNATVVTLDQVLGSLLGIGEEARVYSQRFVAHTFPRSTFNNNNNSSSPIRRRRNSTPHLIFKRQNIILLLVFIYLSMNKISF